MQQPVLLFIRTEQNGQDRPAWCKQYTNLCLSKLILSSCKIITYSILWSRPPRLRSQLCPQCILGAFTPIFWADQLVLDHQRWMLIARAEPLVTVRGRLGQIWPQSFSSALSTLRDHLLWCPLTLMEHIEMTRHTYTRISWNTAKWYCQKLQSELWGKTLSWELEREFTLLWESNLTRLNKSLTDHYSTDTTFSSHWHIHALYIIAFLPLFLFILQPLDAALKKTVIMSYDELLNKWRIVLYLSEDILL